VSLLQAHTGPDDAPLDDVAAIPAVAFRSPAGIPIGRNASSGEEMEAERAVRPLCPSGVGRMVDIGEGGQSCLCTGNGRKCPSSIIG
jgi:hypothetical protein